MLRTEPIEDFYEIGGELGRGKFAVVKKYTEKSTGKCYAAKYLRKRRRGSDCKEDILKEIDIMRTGKDHPRIIQVKEVFETQREIVIILELAEGGELFRRIAEEPMPEQDARGVVRQILEGVVFLHQKEIVHMDLKPENLLIHKKGGLDIKVADFGLAVQLQPGQTLRNLVGTAEYVAPEILNYEAISCASDMWSIGALTYALMTGYSPFQGETTQETFLNVSLVDYSFDDEIFNLVSDNAKDFISKLLLKKSKERFTAKDCLAHSWLTFSSSSSGGQLSRPQPSHYESTTSVDSSISLSMDNVLLSSCDTSPISSTTSSFAAGGHGTCELAAEGTEEDKTGADVFDSSRSSGSGGTLTSTSSDSFGSSLQSSLQRKLAAAAVVSPESVSSSSSSKDASTFSFSSSTSASSLAGSPRTTVSAGPSRPGDVVSGKPTSPPPPLAAADLKTTCSAPHSAEEKSSSSSSATEPATTAGAGKTGVVGMATDRSTTTASLSGSKVKEAQTVSSSSRESAGTLESVSSSRTSPVVEKTSTRTSPAVEKTSSTRTSPALEKTSSSRTSPAVEKTFSSRTSPVVEKTSTRISPALEKTFSSRTSPVVEKTSTRISPAVEKTSASRTSQVTREPAAKSVSKRQEAGESPGLSRPASTPPVRTAAVGSPAPPRPASVLQRPESVPEVKLVSPEVQGEGQGSILQLLRNGVSLINDGEGTDWGNSPSKLSVDMRSHNHRTGGGGDVPYHSRRAHSYSPVPHNHSQTPAGDDSSMLNEITQSADDIMKLLTVGVPLTENSSMESGHASTHSHSSRAPLGSGFQKRQLPPQKRANAKFRPDSFILPLDVQEAILKGVVDPEVIPEEEDPPKTSSSS